jgi:hypothetical protein
MKSFEPRSMMQEHRSLNQASQREEERSIAHSIKRASARRKENSWTAPAFKFWNIVIWLRQTLILDVMKCTLYM